MAGFLTPEEIAKQLKLNVNTVYAWLRSGKLKGLKLGRVWRVRAADLESFLEEVAKQYWGEPGNEGEPNDTPCSLCGRLFSDGLSCRPRPISKVDKTYEPIPYGQEAVWGQEGMVPPESCHDCGVSRGGFHHPGCDMEECPVCHGQRLSCGCDDKA